MVDAARAQIFWRIGSAAVLGPAALAAAFAGGYVFIAMIAIAAAIMSWEWVRLCGADAAAGLPLFLAAAGVAAMGLRLGIEWGIAAAFIGGLLGFILLNLLRSPHPKFMSLGVLYIGIPAMALLWLRLVPAEGRFVMLWLFAVVWATDIGAYVAGNLIGGARLAPSISPHKTWAGGIGGLLAAVAVTAGIAPFAEPVDRGRLLVLSAILAIAAEFGDLLESAIKRRFGVKDTSGLIPGHGGVLDRVDGLVAAAPVALLAVWNGAISPWP